MFRGRTNTASATTRYIKKALAGRIETVKGKQAATNRRK